MGLNLDMLLFSLNGVAPIVLIMLLGYLLRRWDVLDAHATGKLNTLAYRVLIPCNLFMNIYKADLGGVADMPLLLLSVLGHAAVVALLCLIVPRFIHDGAQRGEFIQGVYRGNTAILGIPLITNLYGESATALLALPFSVMLIFYNVSAPLILAVFSGGEKPDPREMAKKVVTNPFLIASLLGVLFSLLHIPLPTFVTSAVNSVGSTGSALALMALGAVTEIADFRSSGKTAVCASLLRLVLIPLVILSIGIGLGMRKEQLAVLVCFFCTPTAVGSYVLAQNVTGDGRLARQILIVTTLLSVITMFVTLAVLRAIGVM